MASLEWIGGLLAALAAALLLGRAFFPVKGVTDLPPAAFREKWEAARDGLLIDVREEAEYRAGHIPKAVNMPLSRFAGRLDQIPKDKPVFLYCQSGMRSKTAARRLAKSGHKEIYNLRGGLLRWPGRLT